MLCPCLSSRLPSLCQDLFLLPAAVCPSDRFSGQLGTCRCLPSLRFLPLGPSRAVTIRAKPQEQSTTHGSGPSFPGKPEPASSLPLPPFFGPIPPGAPLRFQGCRKRGWDPSTIPPGFLCVNERAFFPIAAVLQLNWLRFEILRGSRHPGPLYASAHSDRRSSLVPGNTSRRASTIGLPLLQRSMSPSQVSDAPASRSPGTPNSTPRVQSSSRASALTFPDSPPLPHSKPLQ